MIEFLKLWALAGLGLTFGLIIAFAILLIFVLLADIIGDKINYIKNKFNK